jgi:hypothetical protein
MQALQFTVSLSGEMTQSDLLQEPFLKAQRYQPFPVFSGR